MTASLIKLLDFLRVLALIVVAAGFVIPIYLFESAPDRPDAANAQAVSKYFSTSNKTVTVYMSATKYRIMDGLETAAAASLIGFVLLSVASGYLGRKAKAAPPTTPPAPEA